MNDIEACGNEAAGKDEELKQLAEPRLPVNTKGANRPNSDDFPDETLIFDIGVNAGEDTSFYLEKGFRVVGVEANPRIFDELQLNFAEAIADGSLTLLNIGLWNEASTLPFYVNLDNDHWSSFDPVYGCRDNTRYEIINVPCVSIGSLIDRYGVPRYMKVDIEGGDKLILADLPGLPHIPPIISVEEFGNQTIPELFKAGYRKFKIVPQRSKEAFLAGKMKEGLNVQRVFTGRDSGVFGFDLAGEWLDYDQALSKFRKYVRTADGNNAGDMDEWYDVHAIIDEASIIPSMPIRWLWMLARKQQAWIERQKQELNRLALEADRRVQSDDDELAEVRHALDEERRLRIDSEQALESTKRALDEEYRLRIASEQALESSKRALFEEYRLRADAERQSISQRKRIVDADSCVASQEEQLRIVRAELEAIRSSRTWRMFGPYRRLRMRLSVR